MLKRIESQDTRLQHTVAVFEANGFVLTEHRRVDQATAASLREFAKRTRFRADTALSLISDSEAIEMAAVHDGMASPGVETVALLVFRNGSVQQRGVSKTEDVTAADCRSWYLLT